MILGRTLRDVVHWEKDSHGGTQKAMVIRPEDNPHGVAAPTPKFPYWNPTYLPKPCHKSKSQGNSRGPVWHAPAILLLVYSC